MLVAAFLDLVGGVTRVQAFCWNPQQTVPGKARLKRLLPTKRKRAARLGISAVHVEKTRRICGLMVSRKVGGKLVP